MNTRKIFIALVSMNIFQSMITLFVIILMRKKEDHVWVMLTYISIFFMVLSALITVFALNLLNKAKNTSLIETIKNLETLNTTLREQRHDYLNHIQVVNGLLELGEYEEAKKYMAPVFDQIQKVSMAMKTAQPAVNALLQAKLQMAEKYGIAVYFKITTDLKAMSVEPWELCKVLSNLIDNGITALQFKKEDRQLYIEMMEEEGSYQIQISNNGPKIEKERLQKIFEKGYTTKHEEGHGMGLYIVSSIIKEAGGTITVQSDDRKTCFMLTLDKLQVQQEKMTV